MAERVTLVEVGPRDGLQNEKAIIPTTRKVALVNALAESGLRRIEVTSFVSPKWVPQLADAAEVMAGIARHPGVSYSVLIPNQKGLEAALNEKVDEIAVFTSASEGFCQKNINASIAESLVRFQPVVEGAKTAGLPVRGYVSCVTDCPYDGPVAPEQVARVAEDLISLGCREISLGDTIGAASPARVKAMLSAVLRRIPASRLAGHFHDTRGEALNNIKVSLEAGLRVFDCSIAGLGGCPYAPGAAGNVATEQVAEWLQAEGYETGVNLERLIKVAVPLAKSIGARDEHL